MKYQLAIFDMDGTILDTLEDLTDSMNYTLRHFQMKERTIEEVRSFVGNGIRKLIERAAEKDTESEKIDEMFAFFAAYYKDHSAIKTKPYDGIVEVMRTLKDRGVKLAVVSNKADFAVQDLCRDFFDGIFDVAVGERADLQRKPAKDSVEYVLRILQMNKEETVYIGDSEVDLQTAENSEVDVIPVTWGFREEAFLREKGATFVINKPEELLSFFNR